MKTIIDIDNRKPDDENYPNFEPAEFMGDKYIITKVGQYLVNDDGDIVICTSSNEGYEEGSFNYSINIGYCRIKFLGCRDDYLGNTNQLRPATDEEIEMAKKYTPSLGSKVNSEGQMALL